MLVETWTAKNEFYEYEILLWRFISVSCKSRGSVSNFKPSAIIQAAQVATKLIEREVILCQLNWESLSLHQNTVLLLKHFKDG